MRYATDEEKTAYSLCQYDLKEKFPPNVKSSHLEWPWTEEQYPPIRNPEFSKYCQANRCTPIRRKKSIYSSPNASGEGEKIPQKSVSIHGSKGNPCLAPISNKP